MSSLPEESSRFHMEASFVTATKARRLPSGLQAGIVCPPEGLFGNVTWRSWEPSAATVQILGSCAPAAPNPNHAIRAASAPLNAICRESGDQAGIDPKPVSRLAVPPVDG